VRGVRGLATLEEKLRGAPLPTHWCNISAFLVGGPEVGRKSLPPERRVAGDEKNDILLDQCEQASQVTGIDGINPD
jgi:hypothetical protein